MNKEKRYAINLSLFKFMGFYQMVNPNSQQMFGRNVYNLIHILLIIFTTFMIITGILSFIINNIKEFSVFDSRSLQLLFFSSSVSNGNLKIITIIYNGSKVYKLFNVTHETFLSSKHFKKNFYKLERIGKLFSKIFIMYFFLYFVGVFIWIMTPITLNIQFKPSSFKKENIRFNNVINMEYPFTTQKYNAFYEVIFLFESLVVMYAGYSIVAFNLFSIMTLLIISTQYEIIASGYENIDFNVENQGSKYTFTKT